MTTQNLGDEGFRWFVGVVEDRADPLKQGRIRVRAYNIHGSKVEMPTDTLPWASILMPGYSASLKEVGISPTGVQVGSTVFGFFLDGNEAMLPVIFGILPGKGDIAKLAIEQQTLNKQLIGPEPSSPYSALYPYNKVMKSESGHVVEIDDTPNHERMHWYHRSGTYTEIDEMGRRVDKIVGNDYEIVVRDKTVYVNGKMNVVVQQGITITANVTIDGTLTVTGPIHGTADFALVAEVANDN